MAINKGYLTAGRDKESDECLTPRYAVQPIIKHLKRKGYKDIWCPFDMPNSKYVQVLKQDGFNVINTHIFNGCDFFNTDIDVNIDCIVSNPPFSIKDKVIERCYDLKIPFALLLPQNSLQSQKRVNMFMEHGLEYLGFDKRICFYTKGELDAWKNGNHFASGYFCKDVLPDSMILEKLNPTQEPY